MLKKMRKVQNFALSKYALCYMSKQCKLKVQAITLMAYIVKEVQRIFGKRYVRSKNTGCSLFISVCWGITDLDFEVLTYMSFYPVVSYSESTVSIQFSQSPQIFKNLCFS
jgi:hypothetical protein